VAVRAPDPANAQSANSIAALTKQDVDAMTQIGPSDRRKRETVSDPLRDAIEDYDYVALLERGGRASEADAIVAPLAGSFFAWNKSPASAQVRAVPQPKGRRRAAMVAPLVITLSRKQDQLLGRWLAQVADFKTEESQGT